MHGRQPPWLDVLPNFLKGTRMNEKRPSQADREAIAEDIREGGGAAIELASEEAGNPSRMKNGPSILEEAALEQAEGGGPVAEAVREFDQQTADAVDD